jgi:hypothetical protein
MAEPPDLELARDRLARAEAALMTADGLFHLQEGLALLESIIDRAGATPIGPIARNLGQTYTTRVYARVRQAIDTRNLSEPELEHLFSVVRAFDGAGFELPEDSRELKVAVVRRLIDYYYEGHSRADKEKILEQLAGISGDRPPERRD